MNYKRFFFKYNMHKSNYFFLKFLSVPPNVLWDAACILSASYCAFRLKWNEKDELLNLLLLLILLLLHCYAIQEEYWWNWNVRVLVMVYNCFDFKWRVVIYEILLQHIQFMYFTFYLCHSINIICCLPLL